MNCKDCIYYQAKICAIREVSFDDPPYDKDAEFLCDCFLKGKLPSVHGRLIDADRLYDIIEQKYKFSSGDIHRTYSEVLDIICDAETIIEAED